MKTIYKILIALLIGFILGYIAREMRAEYVDDERTDLFTKGTV